MDSARINFTRQEKVYLIAIVEKYKHILECKQSDNKSLQDKNIAWEGVAKEFNCNAEITRSMKQIKNLYFNLKRKVRKDVANENKEEYIKAKTAAAHDKYEIKKTGGGLYKPQLDEAGAQLLAIMADQVEPLSNPFDDTAIFFGDDMTNMQATPPPPSSLMFHQQAHVQIVPPEIPSPSPNLKKKTFKKTKKPKISYKELYLKKKIPNCVF